MTRVALDSNILVYFAGVGRVEEDRAKIDRAFELVATLGKTTTLVVPVQALGESFLVMRRNDVPIADPRAMISGLGNACETTASDLRSVEAALKLMADHQLQYRDALIVRAATDAGCTLLLSEDMQHGSVSRGLTIVNTFADPMHPKLAALL